MGRLKYRRRGRQIGMVIPSRVRVIKEPDLPSGFRACIRVGRGRTTTRSLSREDPTSINQACASGRNPRKAVAAALRKLATRVSKRTGAFNGI